MFLRKYVYYTEKNDQIYLLKLYKTNKHLYHLLEDVFRFLRTGNGRSK